VLPREHYLNALVTWDDKIFFVLIGVIRVMPSFEIPGHEPGRLRRNFEFALANDTLVATGASPWFVDPPPH